MVSLSSLHILYLILIVAFLIVMASKKSIVIPCTLGILLIGAVATKSIVGAVQCLFNAMIWAGTEFWGIILVISLVFAMSKAISSIGADEKMFAPLKYYMVNSNVTFLILGIVMFAVSLCVWPSPAVALVGALFIPFISKMGMPIIWAAVIMNLFGHGMALSGDYFIQGAPTITAKAAGCDVGTLMNESFILWMVMSIVTIAVAFFMFRKDMKNENFIVAKKEIKEITTTKKGTTFIAILTPVIFLSDIIIMICMHLQGGDATALIGGSALIILVVTTCLDKGFVCALEDVGDYLKEGFSFGISIFAPVIIIGGFFFLGGEGAAKSVFGAEATGILNDIGLFLSQNVPLSKIPAVLTQTIVAVVTGLDGSGFSGLPLVGATAATFAEALPLNKELLASMGQIITIWVGGGTLIPWGVIPVAAICNVSPLELVRKNFIPVICGLVAVILTTLILL